MNLTLHKVLLSFSLVLSLILSGCTTFQIVDLKPQTLPSGYVKHPTKAVVGVETMEIVGGEYRDADAWQQGLDDVLRGEGVFKTIFHPLVNKDKDKINLLIRGKVSGDFRYDGAKNFFTWWPGGLVFAPNWRGTRYMYDAYADVEVIDIYTGKVLGTYHAESSHELFHKSNNPGPFIAALVIVPGVVKGAMSVSPRTKYRQLMYEVAYPNLWKKIAMQIDEDQSKIYSQRIAPLKAKCGQHLNEAPEVGMVWSKFIACQTRRYRLSGQETVKSGFVSVYTSYDRSLRIHVAKDGRITRWFVLKKRKREPSSNVY